MAKKLLDPTSATLNKCEHRQLPNDHIGISGVSGTFDVTFQSVCRDLNSMCRELRHGPPCRESFIAEHPVADYCDNRDLIEKARCSDNAKQKALESALLNDEGSYREAYDACLMAIEELRSKRQEMLRIYAFCIQKLAEILQNRGKFYDSERACRDFLTSRSFDQQSLSMGTALIHLRLASVLLNQQKPLESLSFLRAAYAIFESCQLAPIDYDIHFIKFQSLFAGICEADEQLLVAEMVSRNAIRRAIAVFGRGHLIVSKLELRLAGLFFKQRRWYLAHALSEKVYRAVRQNHSYNHPECLSIMSFLALTYVPTGRTKMAIQYLKDAYYIQEVVLGRDHPNADWTMRTLIGLESNVQESNGVHPESNPFEQPLERNRGATDGRLTRAQQLIPKERIGKQSRGNHYDPLPSTSKQPRTNTRQSRDSEYSDSPPSVFSAPSRVGTNLSKDSGFVDGSSSTTSSPRASLYVLGASAKSQDKDTNSFLGTPLHAEVYCGQESLLRSAILKKENLETQSGVFGSVWLAALCGGNGNIISKLLQKGVPTRESPLHASVLDAAVAKERQDLAVELLKRGANPNLEDPIFGSVLQYALLTEQLDVAESLLEAGADASFGSSFLGCTLEATVWTGNIGSVELLFEFNTHFDLLRECLPALNLAKASENDEMFEYLATKIEEAHCIDIIKPCSTSLTKESSKELEMTSAKDGSDASLTPTQERHQSGRRTDGTIDSSNGSSDTGSKDDTRGLPQKQTSENSTSPVTPPKRRDYWSSFEESNKSAASPEVPLLNITPPIPGAFPIHQEDFKPMQSDRTTPERNPDLKTHGSARSSLRSFIKSVTPSIASHDSEDKKRRSRLKRKPSSRKPSNQADDVGHPSGKAERWTRRVRNSIGYWKDSDTR